ncbi:MAG: acetyl-coenzyme A synthetase N-terminal domain-containing protein, partial [Bacteroidota bacterium]
METEANSLTQKIQQWHSVTTIARVTPERAETSFEQIWQTYQNIYQNEPLKVAWQPDKSTVQNANVSELIAQIGIESYADLYQWSIQNRATFWETVIKRLNIQLAKPYQQILDDSQGNEQVNWLAGAQLNIVKSCFQASADKPALTLTDESGHTETLSYRQLEELVN